MNALVAKFPVATLVVLTGLVLPGAHASPAPSRAALAQQAENEANFSVAFQHYLALFQSVNKDSDEETRLRKKVIATASKLEVPPEVPEAAHVRMQRGKEAIDDSPRASDYRNAANEFRQAIQLAPWWADPYYELALVQETLGEYRAAVVNIRYCLMADSKSRRARKLYSKLAELLDKDDRTAVEKIAEAENRQAKDQEREREFIRSLNGEWRQVYNGATCLWTFDSRAGANFELLPVLLREPSGKERALSRDDRGYFVGEIAGNEIRGFAVSAKSQKAQLPRETVKLNGTFLPKERVLVLRYTFFFDPSNGTPISLPWETEMRFKQVRNQ